MTILGFIFAVCYIPLWTGAAVPTGWIVLSFALPLLLLNRLTWGVPQALMLAFFGYACLGLLWAPVPVQGIWDLWQLGLISGAFLLGTSDIDLRPLYHGLGWGLLPSAVLAVAQLYGFTGIFQAHAAAGLFVNPDVFGEVALLVSVALMGSGIFLPLGWCLPALALSAARTAAFAGMVVAAAILIRRSWVAVVAAILALTAILAVTDFGRRPFDKGITERIAIWKDTYDGLTVFGRGPGSFISTYPVFAKRTDVARERPEDAHNDPLQLWYQFGVGTLLLVPLLAWALLCGPLVGERYILIGYLAISLINFPIKIPILAFLGAFALGRCSWLGYVAWRERLLWRLAIPEWP